MPGASHPLGVESRGEERDEKGQRKDSINGPRETHQRGLRILARETVRGPPRRETWRESQRAAIVG